MTVAGFGLLWACDTSAPREDGGTAVDASEASDAAAQRMDAAMGARDAGRPMRRDGGPSVPMDASTETLEYAVQVPSSVAGTQGLAVRIRAPQRGRFTEGAPIAVSVQGGWAATSVGNIHPDLVAQGVISVGWVFPGATTPEGASGGEFDVRGPDCVTALRDVLRYALGELADMEGQRITDRIPYALVNHVGMLASSNGGNLAIVALDTYISELTGVSWLVAWESPLGDQQANVELNEVPPELAMLGACEATGCPLSSSFSRALQWDPSGRTSARHDRTRTEAGVLSLRETSVTFADLASGFAADGSLRMYPSQELGAEIRRVASTLFDGADTPEWLVTEESALQTYWGTRDGTLHIATLSAAHADFLVMHLQREMDHVQTRLDYPHATAHLRAWSEAGHAFFRLNPDLAYMRLVSGNPSLEVPENEANTTIMYPGAEAQMVPNRMSSSLQTAGVLELVDRVYQNERSVDLDAVLVDFAP